MPERLQVDFRFGKWHSSHRRSEVVSRSISALLVALTVKQSIRFGSTVRPGLRVVGIECGTVEVAIGIAIHRGIAPPACCAIDMRSNESFTLLLM